MKFDNNYYELTGYVSEEIGHYIFHVYNDSLPFYYIPAKSLKENHPVILIGTVSAILLPSSDWKSIQNGKVH